MVSLENRSKYLADLEKQPKLRAFKNLLFGELVRLPSNENFSETDEVFYGIMTALSSDDKAGFEECHKKISRRTPSKDSPSPFINDDFLIFSLILGIKKFKLDENWIQDVVNARGRNNVTTTFENLINGNYRSKNNIFSVVAFFLDSTDSTLLTNELLDDTYHSIVSNPELFQTRFDFQILCALRAYDLVIKSKIPSDRNEYILLKNFNKAFLKRAKWLAGIIQFIVLIALIYGIVKLVSFVPEVKELIDKYDPILGVLGIGIFSFFGNFIPPLRKIFFSLILKLLGYPKELISAVMNKEAI